MRVEELDDFFMSLHHHVVEHVDDIVVVIDALLDDLLDGVAELLVVPDDVRDVLVDVVHVLLELLRDGDISVFELLVVDDIPIFDIPLSSLSIPLSCTVPLSSLSNHLSYLILSIIVPISDVFGRGGDDQ